MGEADYTPVERRIMAVLGDRSGHGPEELLSCLADDMGPPSNLRNHIMRLRAKLRSRGLNIVTELHPAVRYRLDSLSPEPAPVSL